MSDSVYIQHAYESRYVNRKATTTSRTSGYFNSKAIIGREVKDSKYGSYEAPKKTNKKYASKYYDPVARHERYLEEKASLGIGSGGSGGGGGGRSRGSGKSRKGRSGGFGGANFAKQIQKLREESSLNTEAQKEATKRKIEDMRAQLKAQIERLSRSKRKPELGLNSAEIRGNIQRIRKNIENAGGDLQSWIKNEKDSLEKKIGDLYKSKGISYKAQSTNDKENAAKARDKEVKSRADSIYKSTSKK
jgi:hypothetical protein